MAQEHSPRKFASIDCSGNPNFPECTTGDWYIVTVAGKIGGASGTVVGVGAVLRCLTSSVTGDLATVGSLWSVEQSAGANGANISFQKEIDHTISVVTTTTAATAGGKLTITAAVGATTGAGGDLPLAAGAGGNDAVGGVASVTGGAAGGGNRAGGIGKAVGGAGAGSAAGGKGQVTGGIGGATGAGGAGEVTGGAGGATSGTGGAGAVAGGIGTAGNSAGGVGSVTGGAGQGSAAGGIGKTVGGLGGATGAGGKGQLTGGAGGATSGDGGDAEVTGGAGTAGNGNGGSAIIAGGAKHGTGVDGGVILRNNPLIKSTATAMTDTATIGVAGILGGLIAGTPTAAANYTMPTGTVLEAALPADIATGDGIEWAIVNLATNDTFDITVVTAASGITLKFSNVLVEADSATTKINWGRFRAVRTGSNAYDVYRVS